MENSTFYNIKNYFIYHLPPLPLGVGEAGGTIAGGGIVFPPSGIGIIVVPVGFVPFDGRTVPVGGTNVQFF